MSIERRKWVVINKSSEELIYVAIGGSNLPHSHAVLIETTGMVCGVRRCAHR